MLCFALKEILVLFGTSLTATNSAALLSQLYSSLTPWHNANTSFVIMLQIWLAFFTAKLEVLIVLFLVYGLNYHIIIVISFIRIILLLILVIKKVIIVIMIFLIILKLFLVCLD